MKLDENGCSLDLMNEIKRLHQIIENQGRENLRIIDENYRLTTELKLLKLSHDKVYDV